VLRFAPLLLLVWPLLEIATFIAVGRVIGIFPTLALIVLGVVVGAVVLRRQGLGILNRMRTNMSAGTLPGQALFDAMVVAVAAVFLIVPGFLGDLVALGLFLPPVRTWLYRSLTRNVRVVQTTTTYRHHDDPEPTRLDSPGTIDLDDDDWQRK